MAKAEIRKYLIFILFFVFSMVGVGFACVDPYWGATTTTGAPYARYSHTAVWTGSKMLIWGGVDASNNRLNTGGAYDPAVDLWSSITVTGAPSIRNRHTAVWTGSKMIVWGGTSGTNTGGIYDPAADSWTPTTTVNAPSARQNHTAVWTGSKMIIWGGWVAGGYYSNTNTGAIYDPATDSWTPMSTVNAPSARRDHSAVWTGSKMIVWGGDTGATMTSGGAAYDPATDTWTAISTTNAPSDRTWHGAVWTGTKMIIWGGYDGANNVNTGGAYDPSTNTWAPITTTNAPAAREYFLDTRAAIVWTGTKMIVWGGSDGTNCMNTGGAYYPATDTWAATTTTNAPSPRNGHSAVWAGDKTLIWGGADCSMTTTTTGGILYGY